MHRSGFRRAANKTPSLPEVYSAGQIAIDSKVEARINEEFAALAIKLDIFNRRIEGLMRFVDQALTEHSNSMHANMAKGLGSAHAAINAGTAALDMRMTDSNGKLGSILTNVSSALAGTKRELDDLTKRVNAVNDGVRGELDGVKTSISAVHNAVANVTATIARLAKPKKEKMAETEILSKLDDLAMRVDGLSDEPGEKPDNSAALDSILEYIKKPKTVVRDSDGFIKSWKVE